jgi:hypothetical protein
MPRLMDTKIADHGSILFLRPKSRGQPNGAQKAERWLIGDPFRQKQSGTRMPSIWPSILSFIRLG